jgi:hypothetical protein
MDCACGSPLCRETVTGGDWRRAELRQRYGEHWIPMLLDRISAASPGKAGVRHQADVYGDADDSLS